MPGTDTVITNDLALEIARLGIVRESSETGALRRVAELAIRAVPGCAGATAVRWSQDGEPMDRVGSHPELAWLVDTQCASGSGPIFDAARSETLIRCDDTLAETRWPGHTTAALRQGIRCFATTPHRTGSVSFTLTLYGVLPGSLDPEQFSFAALLAAQGAAAMSNTSRYEDVHRTAVQLQQAVEARSVVDQAKGILMHSLGCDADTAFHELRRISQTRHVKLTALAQRIVAGGGLG
jgi:GAF domain-containing protein